MGTTPLLAGAFGLFPAFALLVLLRLIAGIGSAMWNLSRMAYIADVVPLADRGRALSTFGGVGRIGTFVGPFVGGLIGLWFGLEASFYIAGAMSAIGAVISVFAITETRHVTGRAGKHMQWSVVGAVARRHWRDLTAAGSAQIFAQMIRAGRQLIVPLYGAYTLGLTVVEIGSIVSAVLLLALLLLLVSLSLAVLPAASVASARISPAGTGLTGLRLQLPLLSAVVWPIRLPLAS